MTVPTDASADRVGAALRAARRSAGLRRRDAAARVGLDAKHLRNYERGSAQIPEDVANRLAGEYGCDPSQLLPERPTASVILEPRRVSVAGASKALRSDDPHPDEVLRGYLGLLYEIRSTKPGTEIPLRDKDLEALADALGGSPDAIETRLIELMDVTRDEAAAIRATLLRRRLIVPAAGLVLGAGLFTGISKQLDHQISRSGATPTSVHAAPTNGDEVRISTAAFVGQITASSTSTDVTSPSSDDAVTPPADGVTAPPANAVTTRRVVAVTPPPDKLVTPHADDVTAPTTDDVTPPYDEVVISPTHDATPLPTDDATPPPPDEVVTAPTHDATPLPTDDATPPPPDEVVTPPTHDATPLPADDVTPPPDEVVTPPTDDVTPPPADDTTPPPADEATPPPPDEVVTPPADDTTPPPADEATPPPPDEVVTPPSDDGLEPSAPECAPDLLQDTNEQQQVLTLLRDTDVASESADTAEAPAADEQEQPVLLTQQRLSTGLRINRAQDDPAALETDDECATDDQTLQDADSELEQANQAPQSVLQLFR